MSKFKILLIKLLITIGKYTFFGRGKIRKVLIYFVEKIIFSNPSYNLNKPLFKLKYYNFFINFYGDKKSGTKVYFQRSENKELNFLKKKIKHNELFIDIGAYIGMYSLNLANLNSKYKKIKVISIEPNHISFKRLKENFDLLKINNKYIKNNYSLENIAITDKNGLSSIDISENYANSKIIKKKNNKNLLIKTKKLNDIILKHKIKSIFCIKIDTEGFEYKILSNFFKNLKKNLFPKYLIVEHNNSIKYSATDNLIKKYKYKIDFTTNSNYIYKFGNEKS